MKAPVQGPARAAAWVLVAVLLCGLSFVAGRTTAQPVVLPPDVAASDVTVPAREVSLARSLDLTATVRQRLVPVGTNLVTGIVVRVSSASEFAEGDELYRVNQTSVRVVAGALPFFREMREGMSGDDVAQLKDVLHRLGYLASAGRTFDRVTTAAVKRWQEAQRVDATGVVPLGALVAVPTLPTRIALDRTVLLPGAQVSGGEKVAQRPDGEPEFLLVLTKDQASLVPDGAAVSLKAPQGTWLAITGRRVPNEQEGQVLVTLVPREKGTVCGSQCASLDMTAGDLQLPAKVDVVAAIKGIGVPVSAVLTAADGSTAVTVVSDDGAVRERRVTVRGSLDGMAVVEGVAAGERVRVLSQGPRAETTPRR